MPMISRALAPGYTGHKKLPEFGLINMNRRQLREAGKGTCGLCDPALGCFLSPDNYVWGARQQLKLLPATATASTTH